LYVAGHRALFDRLVVFLDGGEEGRPLLVRVAVGFRVVWAVGRTLLVRDAAGLAACVRPAGGLAAAPFGLRRVGLDLAAAD